MAYENLKVLPTPNTTPEGPGFHTMSLTNNTPGMFHTLNDGSSIAVRYAGDYWSISVVYPDLVRAEETTTTFISFLSSIKKNFDNFYISLPGYENPAAGQWSVATNAEIGKNNITMGASANQVVVSSANTLGGTWTIGDMLKFDNSNKIYQVIGSDLQGTTLTITLNSDLIDQDAVATAGFEPNDIKFRVRLLSDIKLSFNAEGLFESVTLNMRENIR